MGWHRNHAISHSPNQNFFEDTFVSHPGGPNEQFGTHEKLSWGGVQGNLNWMPGYIEWFLSLLGSLLASKLSDVFILPINCKTFMSRIISCSFQLSMIFLILLKDKCQFSRATFSSTAVQPPCNIAPLDHWAAM